MQRSYCASCCHSCSLLSLLFPALWVSAYLQLPTGTAHGNWQHPDQAIGKLRAHAVPRGWFILSTVLSLCLTFVVCGAQNLRVAGATMAALQAQDELTVSRERWNQALARKENELRDTQRTLGSCMMTLNRYRVVLDQATQKAQAQAAQSPQAGQTLSILRILAGLL